MVYGELFRIEGYLPPGLASEVQALSVAGTDRTRVDITAEPGGSNHFCVQGLLPPEGAEGLRLCLHRSDGTAEEMDAAQQVEAFITQPDGDETTALLFGLLALDRAAGLRPRLLDVGGRERSGPIKTHAHLGDTDLTVFDIIADPTVDVVGDAHGLSRHFPPESFDYVISTSVFEHLQMPWRVALEINRVLKPGGICFVSSHQSIGLHELPSDYWRFSSAAWRVLFSAPSGFEVLATTETGITALVPFQRRGSDHGSELAVGMESSSVIARKTGNPRVDWQAEPEDLGLDLYPT